jgi:hypothetical protein
MPLPISVDTAPVFRSVSVDRQAWRSNAQSPLTMKSGGRFSHRILYAPRQTAPVPRHRVTLSDTFPTSGHIPATSGLYLFP